jgi:hypothetical protein
MLVRLALLGCLTFSLSAAPDWVLIRTVDGNQVEGQTQARDVPFTQDGKTTAVKLLRVLSIHNGAAASEFEAGRIAQGIAAIQGTDRVARDRAVEELTAIGLPVMTPLLKTYKDTDQHEPRPLYRLFDRLIPAGADGPDRSLSVLRLSNGDTLRGTLGDGEIQVVSGDGQKATLPWSKIRTLAVRQKTVQRSMEAHSLRHSTQIEYLDTGVLLSAASKVEMSARGFVRLSWDMDSWASDADGIKQPGSPAYKTNLVDGHPFGALVGRIGAGNAVFLVGRKASLAGKGVGRLGLAVNDNGHWQNNIGQFLVTLTATDAYDAGEAQ